MQENFSLTRKQDRNLITVVTEASWFELIFMADWHSGHPSTDTAFIQRQINYVKERPESRVLLGGDLIECGLRNSPGASVYEQIQNPQDQLNDIEARLEPIKGQILGTIRGNHEDRVRKQSGFDINHELSKHLSINDLTDQTWFAIKSASPKCPAYTGWYTHGRKASKTLGLALNLTERDIASWQRVDIIARAHTHDCAIEPFQYLVVDTANDCVQKRMAWVVLTGHALGWENSYISEAANRPKPLAFCSVLLRTNDRHGKKLKRNIVYADEV